MCGNTSCTLALMDRNRLRALAIELADPPGLDLRNFQVDAAHLIFDVCNALTINPTVILDAGMVCAMKRESESRLWPVLTEADEAELVELANIRQPVKPDPVSPVSDDDGMGVGVSFARLEKYFGD